MRKLLAALLFFLGLASAALAENTVGPAQQVLCNRSAFVTVASATTTALISGVAGQSIFICGWHVTSNQSAANTFQFEYGTQGGPCTTPTVTSPPFSITSTAPSASLTAVVQNPQIPAGAQFCVVTTGTTVGTAVMVWYSQF